MRHFFRALILGIFFCHLGAVAFGCYPAHFGESLRVEECREAMLKVFTPAAPLARNSHLAQLRTNPNPLTTLPGFGRHGNCVVHLRTTMGLDTIHSSLGQLMRAATLLLEHCVQRIHVGGTLTLGGVSMSIDHIQALSRVPGVTCAQSFRHAADTLSLSSPADGRRPMPPFPQQQNDAPPALKQAADALSLYPPRKRPWPGLPPLGPSAVAEIQQIIQGSPLQPDPARAVFTPFHSLPPLQHNPQADALEDAPQTGRSALKAMPTLPPRQRSQKSRYQY